MAGDRAYGVPGRASRFQGQPAVPTGPSYGFVRPDGGTTDDVFVHISALSDGLDHLSIGDRVEFDVAKQPDGRLSAVTVELVD